MKRRAFITLLGGAVAEMILRDISLLVHSARHP
jgi:hypothetical protein